MDGSFYPVARIQAKTHIQRETERERQEKKRWMFKSCRFRWNIVASTTKALLLFRSLIQFPFYDNKFFIFVLEMKTDVQQSICCAVNLVRSVCMCCVAIATEEPVIEKVRKQCFSDKGIALSTGMIYLVNISILFSLRSWTISHVLWIRMNPSLVDVAFFYIRSLFLCRSRNRFAHVFFCCFVSLLRVHFNECRFSHICYTWSFFEISFLPAFK